MPKPNTEQRGELRAALHDELATLRAVSAALRGPCNFDLQQELIAVRAAALQAIQCLLHRMYPQATAAAALRAQRRAARAAADPEAQ